MNLVTHLIRSKRNPWMHKNPECASGLSNKAPAGIEEMALELRSNSQRDLKPVMFLSV